MTTSIASATTHGIDVHNMDTAALPGVDFYRYCNGGWVDRTAIPEGYPRWGSFMVLRDASLENQHNILQAAAKSGAEKGSIDQKIGDLYFTGMDEASIEQMGYKPLFEQLELIKLISKPEHLVKAMADLHSFGVNVFFGMGSGQDLKDTTRVIMQFGQGGLGMPDREYYTATDAKAVERRAKYLQYIEQTFKLVGVKKVQAAKDALAVLAIETLLASASMKKEDRRDPQKTYNLFEVADFAKRVPYLRLAEYFKAVGKPELNEMNVAQPEFFDSLNSILLAVDLNKLKAYMRFQLVNAFASYLSSPFVQNKFNFYERVLQGTEQMQPRWKRVVSTCDHAVGELVGQAYVKVHFPPEAKAQMLTLVEALRESFRDSINSRTWMEASTRANALKKLDSFVAKIGYPDKWQDYSALTLERISYANNMMRANQFAFKQDLDKIGKPVDKTEWGMTPQTVNAYYNPPNNEIVFPAAILQPPFFDPKADIAANCGGILVVIGHEMSHGFDDKGSQFDHAGNLVDGWQPEDRARFMVQIERLKTQFSSYSIASGEHLPGGLVVGEAAADLGGARLSYAAMQKLLPAVQDRVAHPSGFNDEQRFFIAFGQIWAGKATPEYEQFQVANDPHPAGQFRTNGTVANLPEFALAFGLPLDAPIMMPEAQRCEIW